MTATMKQRVDQGTHSPGFTLAGPRCKPPRACMADAPDY